LLVSTFAMKESITVVGWMLLCADFVAKIWRENVWNRLTNSGDETVQAVFVAETNLPTDKGEFRVRSYRATRSNVDAFLQYEPIAIISGNVETHSEVPVRVHDQCFTSEVLGSQKCDCKEQLDFSLEYIKQFGGVVIYLQQEGRGIGIANKIQAYSLQERGFDTVDANLMLGLPDDSRTYDVVRDILDDLQIQSIQLLTNNPRKIKLLEELKIVITKRIPVQLPPNRHNVDYMKTKAEKMNHLLDNIPSTAVAVPAT